MRNGSIIDSFGNKQWWVNGELHRLDGPAYETPNGYKEWWVNDQLHRLDDPAVEYANGDKEWYLNGKLHRLDGPAIECADGEKVWYYHGKKVDCKSQDEFENWLKENHLEDYNRLKGITTSVSNFTDKIINVDGINYKLVKI